MAKQKRVAIIAYFPGADKADMAANQLNAWDKANDDIKLGGVGILTWEDGKVQTRKVGSRAAGSGAKWGVALGALTGILSGGVTLIGGAVAGAAGGAVMGAFFHKSLGLSDADMDRIEKHLKSSGAVLAVMANADEVAATTQEITGLGGTVETYDVPEETADKVEEATDVKPADDAAAASS